MDWTDTASVKALGTVVALALFASTNSGCRSTASSPPEVRHFSLDLAQTLDGSRPLADCLAITAQRQQDARLKVVLMRVRQAVLQGHTLASAMAQYPDYFSQSYVDAVRQGMQEGRLDDALRSVGSG